MERLPSLLKVLLNLDSSRSMVIRALEDIADALARVSPGEEQIMVQKLDESGTLSVVHRVCASAKIDDEELQRVALLIVSNAAWMQADRHLVEVSCEALAAKRQLLLRKLGG